MPPSPPKKPGNIRRRGEHHLADAERDHRERRAGLAASSGSRTRRRRSAPASPPISGSSETGQRERARRRSPSSRASRRRRRGPSRPRARTTACRSGRAACCSESAKMIMMPICDISVSAKPLLKNARHHDEQERGEAPDDPATEVQRLVGELPDVRRKAESGATSVLAGPEQALGPDDQDQHQQQVGQHRRDLRERQLQHLVARRAGPDARRRAR